MKPVTRKLTQQLRKQPPETAVLTAPAVPDIDVPIVTKLLSKRGDGFKNFRSGI
jgi:hypothetical protein